MADHGAITAAGVPQVCAVLPLVLNSGADLDLNSNPSVYEGLSVGLQWTAENAQYTIP